MTVKDLSPRPRRAVAARPAESARYAVVIPAYQCAASIEQVVQGARAALGTRAFVVVVDDGSSDDTAALARAAGARVTRLERNQGKGAALTLGMHLATEAGAEALVLMDGDAQHAPEDLPRLCAAWEECPEALVIGHRLHDRGKIPPARYWTNRIGSQLLTWMTGYELLDSQSGYRVLSAVAARRLALCSKGYAIESEILLKASRFGMPVVHVEVRTIYGAEISHFQPVRDTTRICLASLYFKIIGDT